MRHISEILDTRRWARGQAGPEPEPAIKRVAPPAPENDTFEDELQASLAITTHYSRFSKCGLPNPSSPEGIEEYGLWIRRFISKGIRTSDFLKASEQLKEMEDVYPGAHLAILLRLVGEASRLRQQAEANQDRKHADQQAIEDDRADLILWEALPPERRAAIREQVVRARPDFARWPRFVLAFCCEAMNAQEYQPEQHSTGPGAKG